ncbi:MAG: hypothetical protein E6J87_16925 [Deltaproteobacteria bacterium]|nr:MAG: hypothetical protein E6J87_16925 [Deltaproteobacteria bacterium]
MSGRRPGDPAGGKRVQRPGVDFPDRLRAVTRRGEQRGRVGGGAGCHHRGDGQRRGAARARPE